MSSTAIARRAASTEPEPFEQLPGFAILRSLEDAGLATSTSLDLAHAGLTFEQYIDVCRFLGYMRDLTAWYIGDAIVAGEELFGELQPQALEATGRSEETLKRYVYVSVSIPKSRRRPALTWSHHREVAQCSPADQTRLLKKAEKGVDGHFLSTRDLRVLAKEANRQDPLPGTEQGGTGGQSYVVEEVEKAARDLLRLAQQDGDAYRVPPEAIARLRAAFGMEDDD